MSDELSTNAQPKKGPSHMDSKMRVGLDISIIAFMMGAAFNAGIVYNKLSQMDDRITDNDASIKQIQRDEQPLSERVARMEAILQDIRDELHQQNETHKP
jgi:hypothetical protein